MAGVDDFDPLNNEFKWEGFEENTVQGFSHEDQSVYRVYQSEQYTEARTDDMENNLATQFLMKENCRGSFVVYKATSPDLVNSSNANDSSKLEACPRLEDTSINNSKGTKLLLSRREIWEIAEYRHKCSCEGVVSDRIHRTNMQRKEGLLALKKTDFTYLDS